MFNTLDISELSCTASRATQQNYIPNFPNEYLNNYAGIIKKSHVTFFTFFESEYEKNIVYYVKYSIYRFLIWS